MTSMEHTDTVLRISKVNALVGEGREDLIAAIIADYERGSTPSDPSLERSSPPAASPPAAPSP